MKRLLVKFSLLAFLLAPGLVAAEKPEFTIEKVANDIRDTESLQRGAGAFAQYCMACHSVNLIRYNRIARDLSWSNEEVVQTMSFGQALPVDMAEARMEQETALAVFGTKVPDLSLITRVKGNDYVYNFLRGYYQDENGKWDNHLLENTAMPNVLEAVKRQQTAEEYDQLTYDLVNFLDYVSEPSKIQRWDLGWKVIAFLLVLVLLTYLLKREYWKDIK